MGEGGKEGAYFKFWPIGRALIREGGGGGEALHVIRGFTVFQSLQVLYGDVALPVAFYSFKLDFPQNACSTRDLSLMERNHARVCLILF